MIRRLKNLAIILACSIVIAFTTGWFYLALTAERSRNAAMHEASRRDRAMLHREAEANAVLLRRIDSTLKAAPR